MAGLIIPQALAYGVVGFAGIFLNLSIILAFIISLKTTESVLDPTTFSLIMQNCVCDLVVTGVMIPLRIWNLVTSNIKDNAVFYNNSVGCWAHDLSQLSLSTAAWVLLSLAATRVVATYWPHKYEFWLNKKSKFNIRWVLYLAPWLITYGSYLAFFLLGAYDLAIQDGMCVKMPPFSNAQKMKIYALSGSINIFVRFVIPLGAGVISYAAIFAKVWHQNRKRNGQQIAAAAQMSRRNTTAIGQCSPADVTQLQLVSKNRNPALPSNNNSKRNNKSVTTTAIVQNDRIRRSLKILAWSYFSTTLCVLPASIVFNLLTSLTFTMEWLWALVAVVQCLSCCASPIVYILTMSDVRRAYVKFYDDLIKCC